MCGVVVAKGEREEDLREGGEPSDAGRKPRKSPKLEMQGGLRGGLIKDKELRNEARR